MLCPLNQRITQLLWLASKLPSFISRSGVLGVAMVILSLASCSHSIDPRAKNETRGLGASRRSVQGGFDVGDGRELEQGRGKSSSTQLHSRQLEVDSLKIMLEAPSDGVTIGLTSNTCVQGQDVKIFDVRTDLRGTQEQEFLVPAGLESIDLWFVFKKGGSGLKILDKRIILDGKNIWLPGMKAAYYYELSKEAIEAERSVKRARRWLRSDESLQFMNSGVLTIQLDPKHQAGERSKLDKDCLKSLEVPW